MSDNSFMKSMFFGEIREDLLFPFPAPKAETIETTKMIAETLQRFAKDKVKSSEWDEKGELPMEIVTELSAMGLMGLAVPEEFGGLGLPVTGYARVMQEVATIDGAIGLTIGAHQSIGYKALLLFGSEEQKKRYLPRLASGELIACYCLTEPSSGSDAASIKTQATLAPDGKHYILKGQKLWITNGGIASFMTVFAKTVVDDGGQKKEKVTCFIVDAPADGISVGAPEHKMGIRGSNTTAVYFDNVRVPVENVIGGIGQGFKVAMGVLNHGRLGLAAGSVGGVRACIKSSVEHANERVQFQKKLNEFGMIQDKIGRMMVSAFVGESIVYMTTGLIDRGDVDYSLESAIAKVFATEALWEAVDENIQIWGGAGYMKEYPFERWMRDARINRIFEGTNEILRAFIALSGMQGPGQELSGLASAIQHPLKGLGLATDYVARKIKQNTLGETVSLAHPALKRMVSMLEEYAVEFATQVDVLLRRHGKQIHLRQFAQKRIADIAIDLYAMACVASRVTASIQSKGLEGSQLEMQMAESFFMRANRRMRSNFKAIDRNDDDYLKAIAAFAFEKGQYPFDILDKP